MEHRGEQLALDLDLPASTPDRRGIRRVVRRPRHAALTAARLLVGVVLAVVLAGVAVSVVPYRTSVAGIDVTISASAAPSRDGVSLDSSLGSLQFRDVTALPLGLHVAPEIDLGAVRAVTAGGDVAARARADLKARIPGIAFHFVLAALVGLVLGALGGRLLVDGGRAALRPGAEAATPPVPRRRRTGRLVRLVGQVATVTVAVAAATGLVGATTYRGDWAQRYQVTGLLADVAATPARLAALDARDSNAADKIRAVLRLQDALTAPARAATDADTAYTVLFISDVHRRNVYPYLGQYIAANDVALIVNTGDETLVGQPAELTADYTASIAAVTRDTPMLWIQGNHDSAGVAAAMAAIPGVTVLDREVVRAFGLQIYGVADPRVYGARGDLGSDDPDVVTRVETDAAADALAAMDRSTYLDLLLAHEPVMADAMGATLGPTVRAQASGHVHRQNPEDELQRDGRIDLVEGTTGLGGLLQVGGNDPMSFSILSVAPDCQFIRVVRYQLADPALPAPDAATSFGENSSFVVHYFDRQDTAADRRCSADDGLDTPVPASATGGLAGLAEWGPAGADVPTGTAVSTPAPAERGDETGDAGVNVTADDTGSMTPSLSPSP